MEQDAKLLGWCTDVQALHRQWDVFAMPSLHEGFGLAALEAMGSGLPIVASDVGGLPELIEDSTTGYLVPPGDEVALAERLGHLLADEALRSRMGSAARERASREFSNARMAHLILEVYDRLLDQ
jgi:glycosyltransferase involved in cell wall biosynthesis